MKRPNPEILTSSRYSSERTRSLLHLVLAILSTLWILLEPAALGTVSFALARPTLDTKPPQVTQFSLPVTWAALQVPILKLAANDNVAVTGYLVKESATTPSPLSTGWTSSPPKSYNFSSFGTKTLRAFAKDVAGNVSVSKSATVIISLPDTTSPVMTNFTVTASATSLTVPITACSASDDVGVTGYTISESPVAPPPSAVGWIFPAPASYTFTFAGTKTLYAFAKDAAGNVSLSKSATVIISLPDTTSPVMTNFTVTASATSLTVPITACSASDDVGVTGYTISESPVAPSPSAVGWIFPAPTSYTFTSAGTKTLYAFAKDAAGNVSLSKSATVIISLPDTTSPVMTNFTIAATATTLNVPITTCSAVDDVGVTGYFVNESATAPLSTDSGWTATAPVSYTVSNPGQKTLYAWAKDAAGNISKEVTATTTVTIPIAAGNPVLLITTGSNPFSSYYGEILKNEGLNAFDKIDVASVTATTLASYDLAVLGEMPLTDSQVTMFTNWVNGGGNLIAMRPDKKLAGLLGLNDQGSTLSEAFMLINTASTPGRGLVNQTIQFHGAADLYRLNGATAVAMIYNDAATPSVNPAATLTVTTNGGQAAAFTFDVARSVVYTRQGNPAWSGQERDGLSPIRSDDLFFGNATYDTRPDWADLDKALIPQADELQRLLANLIVKMNFSRKPLPRFWYLPKSLPAAVVMTGDDHANGGTAGRFDTHAAMSPPNCSVDDWECIRSTSYIFYNSPLTNAQASSYHSAGFEVALHVNTNCADWTPSSLNSFYSSQLSAFKARYTDIPSPVTHRTHCIAWSDYVTQPAVELENGMRLDTTYYYWPSTWVNDRPGFFTGSGMPMRYADSDGKAIDVYQAATQMTDESGQSYPYTIDTLLDNAIGPLGYYGVFVVNAHTDQVSSTVSDAVVNSALSRKIPIVSSRQMLTWLDARNASTFGLFSFNGTTLSFSISQGRGANGLVAMVPAPEAMTVSSIRKNSTVVPFRMTLIKGMQYATFSAVSGTYEVIFSPSTASPSITTVSPPSGATSVSTTTSVSAVFAAAMDQTSISSETFRLLDTSNTQVPATIFYDTTTNIVTLRPTVPLSTSTSFSVIIKGGPSGVKTLSGMAMASDYSWSFSTTNTEISQMNVWPATTVPTVVDSGPDSAVELGVKFMSDVSGFISGIRFYKAATNTGVHVGNLWDNSGKLLATATFKGESSSGWQQVSFATPVAISANNVYVASYHTGVGHYSYEKFFFGVSGIDNPPLHALADGQAGRNGVYAYGATSSFPSNGWNSTNYWVDVVFTPASP